MSERMLNETEANKELFAHLVISLAQSALLHLGKLVNPGTGKAEVNLDAAQMTIDMLDMLDAKSKGNLDKEEERFLKATINELKLNFVETQQAAGAKPEAAAPATQEPVIETPSSGTPPPKDDDDKKRFQKSYG